MSVAQNRGDHARGQVEEGGRCWVQEASASVMKRLDWVLEALKNPERGNKRVT